MAKAFDKIAAGLCDAIALAEGDKRLGRVVAGPGSEIHSCEDPSQPGATHLVEADDQSAINHDRRTGK